MTPRIELWLAALLVLLATAPALAARADLALTLEMEQGELGLAEPVYALVTLTNRGEEAVETFADLALESGLLRVEIESPLGEVSPFVPLAVDDVELERVTLAAGESVSEVVEIFYGGRGWSFRRSGTWQIRAVYEPPGGPRLTAGPVELTIANTSAGLYLFGAVGETSSQTGKFLVWRQGDHLELAREHLRGLLDKHPDSDLASFARLALGLNLAEPFRDFADGTTRPPRWGEALELLAAVDPADLPPSLELALFAGRLKGALATDDAADVHQALAAAREAAEGRPDLRARLEALLAKLPPLPPLPPDRP
ncbi:MAG TPA: hypothetical protein VKU40_03710 [Thermoanaerobaculia bacterium]|nr:hypothetical protein [Thermoanaerobaculia bacterium]